MSGVDFLRIAAVGNGLFSFVISGLCLYYFLKWPLPSPIRQQATRVTLVYMAFISYGLAEAIRSRVTRVADLSARSARPDAGGYIHSTGQVLGGHAICAIGVSVTRRYVTLLNSWGNDWGQGGRALLSFDDLEQLLAAGGEACVPVHRSTP